MVEVGFFISAFSGLMELQTLGNFVAAWGKGRSEVNVLYYSSA